MTEPELVFSEDHNLLMYPKSGFPRGLGPKNIVKPPEDEPNEDNSEDESDESEDNLLDVEEIPVQDFR